MGALKDTLSLDTPPADIGRLVVDTLKEAERRRPRSKQKTLGVSEIGNPCARRLAYKLLSVDPVNTDSDPWPSMVGTGVHSYLESSFKGHPDFLTEVRIKLEPWTKGTADLVHLPSKTVIDHKVVGLTSLKKAKREGMTHQQRVQLNLYATGLRLADIEIEQIAIMFWSRSGMMPDAFCVVEDYDEALVDQALARLDAITSVSTSVSMLPFIPATPTFCTYCPYFLPLSSDITAGCNGVETVDPTQPK